MTPAAEPAPAKVNLALHVTGRRGDGYHLLDSLVVFTELGDTVSARPCAGPRLSVTGPEAAGLDPADENLVQRAAALMGGAGFALTLDKQLPVASGIGGGSSDAAATLRLLARLTGQALPDDTLALGADVPVCVTARASRMQGIGDMLTPLAAPLPPMALVLVNPRVAVSTPAVFARLARRDNMPLSPLPEGAGFDGFAAWLAAQRNDLQAPACNAVPAIADVLAALGAAPGCALARMSGSGATCFGVFATRAAAETAAAQLAAAHPGWWVRPTALRGADQCSRTTT